jgi:hypothetical protein
MIGLPTETDADIRGIADLAQSVVDTYYNLPDRPKGRGVTVTISASSFVPKPHTPFQWEPQSTLEELREKQKVLLGSVRSRKINCNYHEAKTTVLEGVFARGDRRLGKVLLEAHKQGCKFDGWADCFSYDRWMNVFEVCGVSPVFYAHRRRTFAEIMPWDHLDYGVKKSFLQKECERAYEAATTPNCREKCSGCGAACWKAGVCVENRTNLVP